MDPTADTPQNVTGVHRKILEKLWSMEWVPSKELLALTGQAEYARRVRELRGEWGYSIEEEIVNGEHHYRLANQKPRSEARRRQYFTPKQKGEITARDGVSCNLCKYVPPNGRIEGALMWDHRTPLDKGGDTTAANGQLLCVSCNNLKRRTCGECPREGCSECLLSHPEHAAGSCILAFDKDTWTRLRARADGEGVTPQELVGRIVKRHLD